MRACVLLCGSIVAICAAPLIAHDEPPAAPRKVSHDEQYRPSAVPDRIVLSFSGDPSAVLAVTWRTDAHTTTAIAEIAPAEDGQLFTRRAARVSAETTTLAANSGPANYHTAVFRDLRPATRYVYRVGDGVNWSEWNQCTTASDRPEPFSFVYFGDAQNDVRSLWSRIVREAYADAPRAAFLLHAGDLINNANRDGEWGEWFEAGSHINRMVPCMATPGNHEYASKDDAGNPLPDRTLSRHWRPMFAFPENGPEGLEETVYWFDYQGVRFVSLNSNVRQRDQVDWLNRVLTDNPHPWSIVTLHHPIYSSKEGRDNLLLRELWQPVFDKHQVDLVLQGHDHTYARSALMVHESNLPTGVSHRSELGGTVYVVSVSGPKMYDLERRDFMRRAAEDTQLYQIIHVAGDELRYEARTAAGRLYDAFTLRRRDGQVNELIDHIPDTPENRRAPQIEATASE